MGGGVDVLRALLGRKCPVMDYDFQGPVGRGDTYSNAAGGLYDLMNWFLTYRYYLIVVQPTLLRQKLD